MLLGTYHLHYGKNSKITASSQGRFYHLLNIECTDLSTYSAQWVKEVNRGGLKEVNDMVYLLCREIEVEVRKYFRMDSVCELNSGSKEKIVSAIMVNESVQFQWCLLSVDLQEHGAQQLLKMIAELWVTIRGFSFTKSWLESYKQAKGKGTSKSKSLWTKLQADKLTCKHMLI